MPPANGSTLAAYPTIRRKGRRLAGLLLGFVSVVTLAACDQPVAEGPDSATGAPTQAEVMATMERVFAELYATDAAGGAKGVGVELTYGPIQIGSATTSLVEWDIEARAVYPVRAEVTVEASFQNFEGAPIWSRTTTWGTTPSQTFLFYRDAFGDWTFKTGRA